MNNLLVRFDPLNVVRKDVEAALRAMWDEVQPADIAGQEITVSVVYGGANGEDLAAWAGHCGLPIAEAVRLHAAGVYSVAAIGAMPGFPYLSGLDPRLAFARRASPGSPSERARSSLAARRPRSCRRPDRPAGTSSAIAKPSCSTRSRSRRPCCGPGTRSASRSRDIVR